MENNIKQPTVLVRGGTGFIGIYCILQLLQRGYSVKTTLRSLKRKDEVISLLIENIIKNQMDSISLMID